MSILDKLWDDTVAGPLPDSGLGKLRKNSTFNFRSNSSKESDGGNRKSYGEGATTDDGVKVTRSIMIIRPPHMDAKDSPPASPGSITPGSTPPVSPFAVQALEGGKHTGFGGGQRRLRTRKQMEPDPGTLLLLTTCEL